MIFVDFWTLVAVIFFSAVISGLPLAHMIFRNSRERIPEQSPAGDSIRNKEPKEGGHHAGEKYHIVEKLFLALTFGVTIPPLLFVLEAIIGIKYSYPLLIFNFALPLIAGLAWAAKEKALNFKFVSPNGDNSKNASHFPIVMPNLSGEKEILEFAKANMPFIVLALLVFLAFWIRVQTWGPIYQELDPYFYMYGTRQILLDGWPAVSDDTAWYPEVFVGHRFSTLSMYLEASWYTLYTGNAPYNNFTLSAIASFYPPVAAALMSFWAFVLLSARYGNKIGLLAAGIFALLPSTITKMFAGVSEVQSYGLFAMLFLFGAYLLAIRKNDLKIAALAGFAYGVVLIGSQVDIVPNLVIGVFVLAEGIRKYFEKEDMTDFLAINAVLFAGAALSVIVHALYTQSLGLGTLLSPSLLFIGGSLALGALLYRAGDIVSRARPHLPAEKRVGYEQYFVLGIFIVLLAVFFLTPVGEMAHTYAESAVSAASYPVALFRTIAEQGQAGSSFEGTTGFIGFDFKSPDSLAYGFFNIFSSIFNSLVRGVADPLIGWLFGIEIATSEKANSLMLFFFMFAAISLSISYLARFAPRKHGEEGHARDLASTSLFFLLLIFPVAYVGLNKLKYEVFLGIVAAVAACVVFGEADKFGHWLIGKVKHKGEHEKERDDYKKMLGIGMWGLVLLTVFLQFNSTDLLPDVGGEEFTIAKAIFTASFSPRFQDDPVKMAPRMRAMCEEIRKAGQFSEEICGAGYNASYADLVDAQYNSNLCIISQFGSFEELRSQNQLKIAGAQLRCGRLSSYWLDSMEWISKNTPNGSRVISWWDYGHWINYFGERNAVLRNEHSSTKMIQQVAYSYTRGSTEDLIRDMKYFDSKYALFDMELLMSGGGLGGKFGALNYLGCVYANQTDVSHSPSTSRCESENMFESVYAPHQAEGAQTCAISQSQGIEGFLVGGSSAKKLPNGNWGIIAEPRYCGRYIDLQGGNRMLETYYLDRKDEAGNLIPNRGIPRYAGSDGNIDVYSMLYTKDKIWVDRNGTPSDGWDDRVGSFYDSNLYRAFMLRELPGFKEVYETSGGEVKIFELIE